MLEVRKKIYYQESEIRRNLFTYGKEWMTMIDWKEYVGPYHAYETGEVYTESDWNGTKSKRLVPYKDRSPSYFKYIDLVQYKKVSPKQKKIASTRLHMSGYIAPIPVLRKPTEDELRMGKMTRYFVYKRNEPDKFCVEVDDDQMSSFNLDFTGINQYLYAMIEMPWRLTGPEFDEFDENGYLTRYGVVDTNNRIILKMSKKIRILKEVLRNPRELTIYDDFI
jgi:hypothetical protein